MLGANLGSADDAKATPANPNAAVNISRTPLPDPTDGRIGTPTRCRSAFVAMPMP